MKQSHQQNKYSIAWFKIADFVSRGEKERALGVYRLLSHSFEDSALVLQLEADILLSCNDDRAIVKYQDAATLYQQAGKFSEALAVYYHLVALVPNHELFLCKIVSLHLVLNNAALAQQSCTELLHQFGSRESLALYADAILQDVPDVQQLIPLLVSAIVQTTGSHYLLPVLLIWVEGLHNSEYLQLLRLQIQQKAPELASLIQ